MDQATFNPGGQDLWVTIKMEGLYYMAYTYFLYGGPKDPMAILTNPIQINNNRVLVDDAYRLENTYQQNEPIGKSDERAVSIAMDIWQLESDDGYEINVSIWQVDKDGIRDIAKNLYKPGYQPPVSPLKTVTREGTVGAKKPKEEKFMIMLLKG